MEINYREGDLEFRNTESLNNVPYFEIVKWVKEHEVDNYCFTLASWVKTKEGYDLRFCSNRPFQEDYIIFMEFACKGQKVLEALHDKK